MNGLAVDVKERLSLHRTYLQKTLQILIYVFDCLYFTQCLTSFSSINHVFHLHAQFLILFHLALMRSPRSIDDYLLMFLSLETLKVVSPTFLLVCFVCLKVSTFETKKNAFYFTLKALLAFVIIKFQHFRYSNVMTSSNAQA